MKTLTLNISDNIDLDNLQVAMLVASMLYEQGKRSLGQAIELTGLTKRTFTELLGVYNISVFNCPTSERLSDIANT